MNSLRPTVVIVDDDASVRKAMTRLLQSLELQVLAFASAQEYLEQYDSNQPGCVVLDLAMPGLNGLELQDTLAASGNAPPIIFLTGQATVPDSVLALKHGAIDFLTKPVDEAVLLDAVRNAIETDRIARAQRAERAQIEQRLATLTTREVQVLRYLVAGSLNKQIASELGTVEKTIKVHRARVMEKLQVHSVAELVLLATQAGVTAVRCSKLSA